MAAKIGLPGLILAAKIVPPPCQSPTDRDARTEFGKHDLLANKARQSRFLVSHQRPLGLKHFRFNFHYCIFKMTHPLYLHVILKHVSSSWQVIFSLYEKLQAGSLEFALNAINICNWFVISCICVFNFSMQKNILI